MSLLLESLRGSDLLDHFAENSLVIDFVGLLVMELESRGLRGIIAKAEKAGKQDAILHYFGIHFNLLLF